MKVVLILPPFNVSNSWGSARRMKEGVLPALGVGYLGAELQARGQAVSLIDAPALELDAQSAAAAVLQEEPGVVGISCLSVRAHAAYALAQELKARAPELPVVMGGPHVSAFWRQILQDCEAVDILIPGEAELTFADLVGRIDAGEPYCDLAGLVFRGPDGEQVETSPATTVRDLDMLRFPARHLYDQALYRSLPNQGRRSPSTIVITSRGCCWRQCTFCYNGRDYAVPYRRRSPENVITEIGHLVRDLGYREIMFWDDNFCVGERWIDRFCDLLDEEGLDITWTVEGHVRTVTKPMFDRMAASGCYNVFFGVESGNPKTLEMLKKGFTLDECRQAIAWAKQVGFEVRCSYMLGLPQETRDMAEDTIQYACELNTDYAQFVPYHVWPHTPLEDLALRKGRKVPWNDDLLTPSYVPNTLSGPEELKALIESAYRRYYFRPRYIATAMSRAWRPNQLRRMLTGFRYWLSLMSRSA